MICKKCNAIVSEEGAVYCHECGARLDGKKPCPSCGQFVDETHVYCEYCGARTDGKVACPSCGTYQEGAFCVNCGTPLTVKQTAAVVEVKSEKKPISSEKKQKIWSSVFAWVRSGAGLACAVLALIFVFFVGFTAAVSGNESAMSGLGISAETHNIFYFFGDVYKEIAQLTETSDPFKSEIPQAAGYVYAISGTVISAAMIGCVVAFATVCIVGFIRFATSGKENNGAKWGVGSALALICGSALLYALNVFVLEVLVSSNGVTVLVKMLLTYNGATVAGIVLCAIFVAIYAVGNLVRKGAAWKEKKTIVNAVLAVVGSVFAVVALAVGKGAFVGISFEESGTMFELSFAQYWNNIFLISLTGLTQGSQFYNEHLDAISLSCVFSFVQQFAAFATVGCGVGFVLTAVLNTEGEKQTSGLRWAIPLVCCAAVQLVSGIIGQTALGEVAFEMGKSAGEPINSSLQMGASIVALVFAVLCLAVSIVKKCLQKPTIQAVSVEEK